MKELGSCGFAGAAGNFLQSLGQSRGRVQRLALKSRTSTRAFRMASDSPHSRKRREDALTRCRFTGPSDFGRFTGPKNQLVSSFGATSMASRVARVSPTVALGDQKGHCACGTEGFESETAERREKSCRPASSPQALLGGTEMPREARHEEWTKTARACASLSARPRKLAPAAFSERPRAANSST